MAGFPSPHEPFVNPQGVITRTWYRVLDGLKQVSGSLSQPIVVKPNSFFVSGTLDSGSTLEPNTIPDNTILGNSSGGNEAASAQTVGPSLVLNDGTINIAEQAPSTILGNAGNADAVPGQIAIGSGLSLQPGSPPVLNVIPDAATGTDLAGAQTLSWWRGG
jgi:hypothetical protein